MKEYQQTNKAVQVNELKYIIHSDSCIHFTVTREYRMHA